MTTFAALKTSNTIKITVMRKLILTMVLLLSAVAIIAQDRTITGTLYDGEVKEAAALRGCSAAQGQCRFHLCHRSDDRRERAVCTCRTVERTIYSAC